jgi:hypothetical protein
MTTEHTCYSCHGDGEYDDHRMCRDCKGTGYVLTTSISQAAKAWKRLSEEKINMGADTATVLGAICRGIGPVAFFKEPFKPWDNYEPPQKEVNPDYENSRGSYYANDWQDRVRKFNELIGVKLRSFPGWPCKEDIELAWNLIKEECQLELGNALDDRNLVDVADAIGDSIVVLLGLACRLGIDMDPIFQEINRTNMLKVGGPKRADGKVGKPEGWKPPYIESLLVQQGWINAKVPCVKCGAELQDPTDVQYRMCRRCLDKEDSTEKETKETKPPSDVIKEVMESLTKMVETTNINTNSIDEFFSKGANVLSEVLNDKFKGSLTITFGKQNKEEPK